MSDLTYDSDDKWPHAAKSIGWALMWAVVVFSGSRCTAEIAVADIETSQCHALPIEDTPDEP